MGSHTLPSIFQGKYGTFVPEERSCSFRKGIILHCVGWGVQPSFDSLEEKLVFWFEGEGEYEYYTPILASTLCTN
jgi:hypothetical protein